MADQRITVWVQARKDRSLLALEWNDPETGKRKSRSAGTADPRVAEKRRADLEYELNHGRYREASHMAWGRFRVLFEAEYLPNLRPETRTRYTDVFDLFERLCSPARLKGVTERTVSAFAGAPGAEGVPLPGQGRRADHDHGHVGQDRPTRPAGRRAAEQEDPAPGLRLQVRGQGAGPGPAETDAARQHHHDDGLLRQRG
jgi:hypothetical protein